jgi:DNA-binding transcriptional LysR family regulator
LKITFNDFEMSRVGTPTVDQLTVFLAVVETGSFAAAGRRLGRATSAISYTIAHLEGQLGVALFDRQQTRKPVLTEAGRAVLAKATLVTAGIDDLRATVKGLHQGLEAEVSLAVDVMLPAFRLTDAVQAFEARFPTVTLRLHVEALGAVAQLVQSGAASIGVAGSLHTDISGIERIQVGNVEMIAVAAPDHPLARANENPPGAARQFRQLILTVRSPFTEGGDIGVLSPNVWRLADLGAKHALLLAGLGWGNMPEPMVRADVSAGRLVRLSIPDGSTGVYPLQAIYRSAFPPGPAGEWMMQRFLEQAG